MLRGILAHESAMEGGVIKKLPEWTLSKKAKRAATGRPARRGLGEGGKLAVARR